MSCPPSRFYIDEHMDSDSSGKGSKKRTAITDVFPMIMISSEQKEDGGSTPERTPVRRGSVENSSDVARVSENLSLGVTNDKMRRCNSYNDLQSATLDNASVKPSGAQLNNGLGSKPSMGSRTKSATCLSALNSENESTKPGCLSGTNQKDVVRRAKSPSSPSPTKKHGGLEVQHSPIREPSPSSRQELSPANSSHRSRSPSPYRREPATALGISDHSIRERGRSPGRMKTSSQLNVSGGVAESGNGKHSRWSNLEEMDQIPAELEHELEEREVEKILKTLKANYKEKKYMTVDFCPLKRSDSEKSLISVGFSSSDDNIGDSQRTRSAYWKEFWTNSSIGSNQNQIKTIRDMCFTSKGYLAVTEEKNARVQIFNRSGKSLKILKGGSNLRRMQPGGICQSPNPELLAVTDLNWIVYLDPAQDPWETGVQIKDMTDLAAIATTREGKILLTDVGKKPSVGIYDTSGAPLKTFKTKDLHLKNPNSITPCNDLGLICVADCELGSVFILDQNGKLVTQFGQQGVEASRLVYPKGISYLSNGRIAVVDRALNRLLMYDLRSLSVDHMLTSSHGLQSPCAMAYDGRGGYLAIAEENQDWKLDEYKLKMFKQRI